MQIANWDNGIQSMGKFQRSCVEVVKKLHEETDWQLRFIDQNSIQRWFSPQQYLELAQFLDPKFQVTKQTRANFIRYFLLRQHGGVWLDVSIILHQNLNWLDDLKNNPRVFNRQMSQNPEVFMFVICVSQKEKGSIIHNGKLIYPRLYMENSMIAAVKKSQFIIDLINQYKIIIKQTKAQYDQTMLKLNVPYHYDPYFRAYLSEVVTVYRKFYNYYSASEQQKKTFQFYKLWGLQRQYGLYHKLDKRSFYFFFQSEYFRLYFQVNSIKIQSQLWYQGNPLAWKTIVIEIFLLVVLVRNILGMSVFSYKKQIKLPIFYLNFGLILILKYLSWYFFAIWQYQGPIFRYRQTSDDNLFQLFQMQKNILKMIVLIAIYLLIISAKSILNLYVAKSKQKLILISKECKQKDEHVISERNQYQQLKIKEKNICLNNLEEETF